MKPSVTRFATAKSVCSHLNRDPASMPVMAHASSILRAAMIYQQIISPGLARVSRVANLKSGVIIIHTDHGAAASKLKQQTRHLIDEFIKKGLECNEIEIRVQPSTRPEGEKPATQKPVSELALASMAQVANGMRTGSPLKARIEHFLTRTAKKS